ncbi:MAG: diacylglycerol kinase family lipid kinase [Ruminococcus sp.]|nr:diacylglycerol kinase family lipid kinase [Ruminococcus sp.]
MRHIFIINPAAGKKDSTQELRRQIHSLKTDESVEVYITKGVGDARRKAQTEASVGDELRIYSCGGDGTANEVLSGIAGHKNCALGIIPLGSGNDFVRAFEPLAKEAFLDVQRMIEGEERSIDLLECNGNYSMNVMSVGFDAEVAKNVDKFKRWPMVSGSFAYKLSIVYCLFTKRRHRVKILLDGEPFQKADYDKTTLLAVGGNGKFYGGGIKAAPLADLSDGYMDFVHANTLSVLKFATMIGIYTKGEHINNPKLPFITFKRCKKIKFIAEEPIALNLDGEIFMENNPEVTLLEGALRIILPKQK